MPENFSKKVLDKIKNIPKGKVSTYQAVAIAVGNSRAARAVGNALNKNFRLIKIPCHRVIKSSGAIGGYKFGTAKKKRLLQKEGVKIRKNKIADLGKHLYQFK